MYQGKFLSGNGQLFYVAKETDVDVTVYSEGIESVIPIEQIKNYSIEDFKLDSDFVHEVLHTTHIVLSMVEEHILNTVALVAYPELYKETNSIITKLSQLYSNLAEIEYQLIDRD